MEETRDNIELLHRAVNAFGIHNQKNMCIEECSELIDALMKEERGRESDVITEIADVFIMVRQMAIIYGEKAVALEISRKLDRLETIVSEKEKLINKKNHGINN